MLAQRVFIQSCYCWEVDIGSAPTIVLGSLWPWTVITILLSVHLCVGHQMTQYMAPTHLCRHTCIVAIQHSFECKDRQSSSASWSTSLTYFTETSLSTKFFRKEISVLYPLMVYRCKATVFLWCVCVCVWCSHTNVHDIFVTRCCSCASLFLTVADCGSLTNPANGQVSTTGTTEGQTATYGCDTGYNLVGDNTRTCQANGDWSGSEPTCQRMLYIRLLTIFV